MIGYVVAFFLAAIIILLLLALWAITKANPKGWREMIEKKLSNIDLLVQEGRENDIRTALIQIDAVLDAVLQQKRIPGSTLGERLKNARDQFDRSTYNAVWEAHKLRNKIVHEIDYRPPISFVKQNYMELKFGIKQLMRP
ncbi:hypothetical protein KBD09_02255 [Candidatus Woesebacteria bacterium]|jgi:hypothetical protein|nr:hypothetical protein [Candidatus Woesebacteria bacterium]